MKCLIWFVFCVFVEGVCAATLSCTSQREGDPDSLSTANADENSLVCSPEEITTTVDKETALLEKLKTELLPEAPKCGTKFSRPMHLIRGGSKAKFSDFPWLVLLQYKKPTFELSYRCGGSVINGRYVLTAAHCLNKSMSTWELISVRIGEWDLLSNEDCNPDEDDLGLPSMLNIGIAEKIVHPLFRVEDINTHYDIALLRLQDEIQFNKFVKPICLPIAKHLWNMDYMGERLTAAGWEKTEKSTECIKKLFVNLPFFDHEECQKIYAGRRTLNDHQICAGGEIGKDTCKGASGGPLMTRDFKNVNFPYYIAGIVSYGEKACGTRSHPGVYTKVADYLEWIVDNIRP